MSIGKLMDWNFIDATLQNENLDALNKYFMTTKIKTKEAEKLKTSWLQWWETLGWYDLSVDPDTFDIARNRKNAFDLANAVSASEKTSIKEAIKTGFTTEEALGGTRGTPAVRRTTSDGTYLEDPIEKEPFVPTRIKVVGAIALAAVGALWAAKTVYLNPILKLRKVVS